MSKRTGLNMEVSAPEHLKPGDTLKIYPRSSRVLMKTYKTSRAPGTPNTFACRNNNTCSVLRTRSTQSPSGGAGVFWAVASLLCPLPHTWTRSLLSLELDPFTEAQIKFLTWSDHGFEKAGRVVMMMFCWPRKWVPRTVTMSDTPKSHRISICCNGEIGFAKSVSHHRVDSNHLHWKQRWAANVTRADQTERYARLLGKSQHASAVPTRLDTKPSFLSVRRDFNELTAHKALATLTSRRMIQTSEPLSKHLFGDKALTTAGQYSYWFNSEIGKIRNSNSN